MLEEGWNTVQPQASTWLLGDNKSFWVGSSALDGGEGADSPMKLYQSARWKEDPMMVKVETSTSGRCTMQATSSHRLKDGIFKKNVQHIV